MWFSLTLVIIITLLTISDTNAATSSIDPHAAGLNKVVIGYFPSWLYESYPPSMIDFKKFTHIYYAFAIQNQTGAPVFEDPSVLDEHNIYSFQNLVRLAKSNGTKVCLSIGGWTGSTHFSSTFASPSARAEFIKWNLEFIAKYNTDCVDIDWEYPGSPGAGCNQYSPDDVDNFLTLIRELRVSLQARFPHQYKEITMANYVRPWGGEHVFNDVSSFVPYVDRFDIMTYDINGPWNSTSGPNSPFRAQSGKGFSISFTEAIEIWHAAGVPYNKLAAGVAFYGHAFKLLVSSIPKTQYNPTIPNNPPLGDQDDGPFTNPYCPSDSVNATGQWKYRSLRSQGILKTPTTAVPPWIRRFDPITKTPWLYNPINKQYISYDDPVSLGFKSKWAVEKGLAGLFAWSIDQDNGELTRAIQLVRITKDKGSLTASVSGSKATAVSRNNKPCSGVRAYDTDSVYTAGSKVIYGGKLYSSKWWTQGNRPRNDASEENVWKYLGYC